MKKIDVEIKGLCSYIQHRMPSDKKSIDEMKQVVKVLSKNMADEKAFLKEAELGTYKNSEGYCIPSAQIEGCLTKAGVTEKVSGQGRKTYKDYMNAFVMVEPDEITINPQEYEIDRRFVRVQRSRIMRTRPKWTKGWTANFQLMILDDTIPTSIVKTLLEHGGMYVGIGDWRPKFGRFEVTKFQEVTN
jgi:hypothetical protein